MEIQSYFTLLIVSVALLHVASVQMSIMEAELYDVVPLGMFIAYNIYFSFMMAGYLLSVFCLMKLYRVARRQCDGEIK